MQFSRILGPESIKMRLASHAKEDVVHELISALPLEVSDELRRTIFDSVMERERDQSMGLGSGVALPHGTAPIGCDAVAALGFASEPVDFDAIDDKPVHVVILLVTSDASPSINVEALSRVARLLHSCDFQRDLTCCASPEEVMEVIRRAEGGAG